MQIIQDMPAADYHAHPAVSKSVLDKVAKTPAHARAYLEGTREAPTAAMQFGTALHAAVLEPAKFAAEFRVFEGDRRTKAGKADYDALVARGVQLISRDDADVISAMVESVTNHPVAGDLLLGGQAEASVFWKHPGSQLECKARPDFWSEDGRTVVDLKTCEDASPAGFARSVAQYRYHVQAAHYLAGTHADRFVFVAVEKKAPYCVAVYELDRATLDLGVKLRNRDLANYASCVEFGIWPGYPAEIQTLGLPAWAVNATGETE